MSGLMLSITLILMFLLCEVTSSIGMVVYFKRTKRKYPALVLIPIYKYYYFAKNSYGFCPVSVAYNLPAIILPIFYVLMIAMLFIGLESFIVCFMFFAFYSAGIFNGIYLYHNCKDVLMKNVLSAMGFSFPILLYVSKQAIKTKEV